MAPIPLRTLFKHKLKPWRSFKPLSKEEQEELELIKPSSSSVDGRPPPKNNTVGNMQRPKIFRGGMTSQGIKRFGQKGAIFIYLDDLYHTLLNMPRYRFLGSFFVSYLLLYLLFAFVYMMMPAECICSEECGEVTFSHAFWFSVQTASTIGYSTVLVPSPDCDGINFLTTFHLMVAALVDTMLMSLVFARFAAPMPRASTVRFSVHALVSQHSRSSASTLKTASPNISPLRLPGHPSATLGSSAVAIGAGNTPVATGGGFGGLELGGSSPLQDGIGSASETRAMKGRGGVYESNGLHHAQQHQQGAGHPLHNSHMKHRLQSFREPTLPGSIPNCSSLPLSAPAPSTMDAGLRRRLSLGVHDRGPRGIISPSGSTGFQEEIRFNECGTVTGCLGGGGGLDCGLDGVGEQSQRHGHLEGVAGSPGDADVGLEGDAWMMSNGFGLQPMMGGEGGRGASGGGSNFWGISFRVANIRKHSLLHPELSLLLTVPDLAAGNAAYRFVNLEIDDLVTQETNLRLGLPAIITHIIDPKSPLFDLSLEEMEAKEMEILCFMSGTDPMTSNSLQARHVYGPSEMRVNEWFNPISIRSEGGKVALDMSVFDDTNPSRTQPNLGSALPNSIFSPLTKHLQQQPMLMADLKIHRFRDLTEALVQEQKETEMQHQMLASVWQQQQDADGQSQLQRQQQQQQQQQQLDADWSALASRSPRGEGDGGGEACPGLDSKSVQQQLQGLCAAFSADAGVGQEVKTRAAALLAAVNAQAK